MDLADHKPPSLLLVFLHHLRLNDNIIQFIVTKLQMLEKIINLQFLSGCRTG
jgi:hypothetical protein